MAHAIGFVCLTLKNLRIRTAQDLKLGLHFARNHDQNGKQNQKTYALPVLSVPAHYNYDRKC